MTKIRQSDPTAEFEIEARATVADYKSNAKLQAQSGQWLQLAFRNRYMYHFSWLGRPIIQLPADIVAVQEIIYRVKPDLIIETGIAHGGSLILSASMLALLEIESAIAADTMFNPSQPKRKVLGIDIDIRKHNRAAIERHPMARWIEMLEGSSITTETIERVRAKACNYGRILVFLDSNHTHDHVLAELEAYAPLVSPQSYCVVFDTAIEHLPDDTFPDRPWSRGNNPKTAIEAYLAILNGPGRTAVDGGALRLELDQHLDSKLLLSAAPGGYLMRVT